jgi:hypothetical protein
LLGRFCFVELSMSDTTEELYTYPARILPAQTREHPALVGVTDPFIRAAEISSNRLDAYFTRMDPATSLQNYARHAADGVSVLDSHDSGRLGVGYSFTGERSEGEDGAGIVLSDWYTVPGIRFGGTHSFASTDDYIRAVENRIVRSISVGFYGGRRICDICKQNYYSFDCSHIAGMEYQIENEDGVSAVLATATIFGANLAEYSLVYKGATPGATIRKIEREIEEGRLSPESINILENRYRIQLPHARKTWAGETKEKKHMENQHEEQVREIGEILVGADFIVTGGDPVVGVRGLLAEVNRLAPLAADGRQYRADLVDEALAEGVRANGAEFPQETYRTVLEGATIPVIQRMRDDWRRLGDERLKGGRQTTDTAEEREQVQEVRPIVPASAYKV